MSTITEKQAAEKWCPMARVIFQAPGDLKEGPRATSFNRSGNPVPLASCIGGKCMAWRWSDHSLSDEPEGCCGLASK